MSMANLPEEAVERYAEEATKRRRGCACTLYAVVNSDGTLARSFRAVSAKKLGPGQYEVIFNRNVRKCAYVATIGLPRNMCSSPPGEITVAGRYTTDRGVFVTTYSSVGTLEDRGFHLAVHCRPEEDCDDED
jgi:hypothetical protein